jgi:hypothetical protein
VAPDLSTLDERAGGCSAADGAAPRSRVPTDNPTTRVYAHATGEWRQAALDELATLIADSDPGREQRAT